MSSNFCLCPHSYLCQHWSCTTDKVGHRRLTWGTYRASEEETGNGLKFRNLGAPCQNALVIICLYSWFLPQLTLNPNVKPNLFVWVPDTCLTFSSPLFLRSWSLLIRSSLRSSTSRYTALEHNYNLSQLVPLPWEPCSLSHCLACLLCKEMLMLMSSWC